MLIHRHSVASFAGIDLFKFIMAIIVVAIHSQPFFDNEAACDIFKSISRYAVPFFFLCSGFFIGRRLDAAQSTAEKCGMLRAYASKILRLYLIWSLIYLPLAVYHYCRDSIPFVKALLLYIRGLLLIGEHFNSWQLWYLLSLLFAIALLWLLIRLNAHAWVLAVVSCIALVISACFSQLVQSQVTGLLLVMKELVSLSIANGKILQGLFYFPVGTLLSRRTLPGISAAIILCAGYGTARLAGDELWLLSDLAYALSDIALFSLVSQLPLKSSSITDTARRLSTYVYFMHMLVFSFISIILLRDDSRLGMGMFLMTAAGSVLISIIYDYFKRHTTLKK